MFLSSRELRRAIERGDLIVRPPPTRIDPTSIDLHLDNISQAKVWDLLKYKEENRIAGRSRPELHIGTFDWLKFNTKYLKPPPPEKDNNDEKVFTRGENIIIQPGGFLLWQTKEFAGTPAEGAKLICFIEGRSTKARTGLVVHLTAPTIHATWAGNITLEIVNLGPFDLVLKEDDVIAQLTVARITSRPDLTMQEAGSITFGQTSVTGAPPASRSSQTMKARKKTSVRRQGKRRRRKHGS